MFGLLQELFSLSNYATHPLIWIGVAFQIWMLVDAIRREEWIWAGCILVFSVLSAVFYFFMVYWSSGPVGEGKRFGLRSFELPGGAERRRIKELQSRIHHLDKARDHADLADVYRDLGKLSKAEASYRQALARDPDDIDIRSHFAECLLLQERAAEARPILEAVILEEPRHNFSFSLMALAEAQTALGDPESAQISWRKVLETNSYSRAKVQYAELLAKAGDRTGARKEVDEVIADEKHGMAFQKKRDRIWVGRAKALRARLD